MTPHTAPTLRPTGDEDIYAQRDRLASELLRARQQVREATAALADRRADCDALRRLVERLQGVTP